MKMIMITALVAFAAGCTAIPVETPIEVPAGAVPPPVETLNRVPPPPALAVTVAQFDTVSDADRREAINVSADAAIGKVGETIATLGSPRDPGIWLKTPLVENLQMGRITYEDVSINIELRPSGGAPGGGSQISLSAMRLIGAPLTSFVKLEVFARP